MLSLPAPLGGPGAGPLVPVLRDTMLDPLTGDIARGPDDSLRVGDRASISQAIDLSLSLQGPGEDPDGGESYDGEWFLDPTIGIDWWGQVLVKEPNVPLIRAALTAAVLRVQGVTSVESLTFAFGAGNRSLSIAWQVHSDAGLIDGTKLVAP